MSLSPGATAGSPEVLVPPPAKVRRGVRSWVAHQRILTVPFVALLVATLVGPVSVLVVYSVLTPGFYSVELEFTLRNFQDYVASPTGMGLLGRSIGTGLVVTTVIVVVSYVIAYTAAFKLGRFGNIILLVAVLSTMASFVARVSAWGTILGTNGLINRSLLGLGVISEPLTFLLFGRFAVGVVLIYMFLPLGILTIYAGLIGIDRDLVVASRDLGATSAQTFWRIVFPLSGPSVMTAFALCFILATSDYVTPRLVGGLSGQMAGATIETLFMSMGNYPRGAATAIAFVGSMGLVLAVLGLIAKAGLGLLPLSARMRSRPRTTLRSRSRLTRTLPRLRILETLTAVGMVYLLAPVVILTFFSFNDSPITGLPWRGFTTRWYTQVVNSSSFINSLQASLVIGSAAVVGSVLVGLPVALYLSRRGRDGQRNRLIEVLAYAPIAVPGVVIGAALLSAMIFVGVSLGRTPTAVVHMMLVAPFIILIVRAQLLGLDPSLEEAARDLGARKNYVLRTITLPLIRNSLVAATLLAAAISLDQLVVTNFTIGSDSTVPTWIFGQMEIGLSPSINAAAVIMLLIPTVLAVLSVLMRKSASVPQPDDPEG